MKKYEKPAIEIVEANLSGDYLTEISGGNTGGQTGEYLSPSKKGSSEDDFGDDW